MAFQERTVFDTSKSVGRPIADPGEQERQNRARTLLAMEQQRIQQGQFQAQLAAEMARLAQQQNQFESSQALARENRNLSVQEANAGRQQQANLLGAQQGFQANQADLQRQYGRESQEFGAALQQLLQGNSQAFQGEQGALQRAFQGEQGALQRAFQGNEAQRGRDQQSEMAARDILARFMLQDRELNAQKGDTSTQDYAMAMGSLSQAERDALNQGQIGEKEAEAFQRTLGGLPPAQQEILKKMFSDVKIKRALDTGAGDNLLDWPGMFLPPGPVGVFGGFNPLQLIFNTLANKAGLREEFKGTLGDNYGVLQAGRAAASSLPSEQSNPLSAGGRTHMDEGNPLAGLSDEQKHAALMKLYTAGITGAEQDDLLRSLTEKGFYAR